MLDWLPGVAGTPQVTDEQRARLIHARMVVGAPVSASDSLWMYSRGRSSSMWPASPYSYFNPARTSTWSPTPPTTSPAPSPEGSTAAKRSEGFARWKGAAESRVSSVGFWTAYGHQEYKNLYLEPVVPAGWTVESITKTPAGEPEIQLRLTNLEAALASGQTFPPEVMETYLAKKRYQKDVAVNEAEWAKLGYPQYGGIYTAPEVTSGYKIRNITESDLGLSIQFEPIISMQDKYGSAIANMQSQKSQLFAEKYSLAIASMLTQRFNEKYGPAIANMMGTRYEQMVAKYSPAMKSRASQLSQLFVEKYTPAMANRASQIFAEKYSPAIAKMVSQKATKPSTDFYTGIGYPEFAGKYEPFETPSGFVLASLKETYVGESGPLQTPRLEARFKDASVVAEPSGTAVPTRSPLENALAPVTDWLSGTVSIGGPPSFAVIGGVQTMRDYGLHLTRGEALAALAVMYLPFVAPVALPSLGLSTTGIIASAGVSVGVSEAASLITSGKHISPSQVITSALVGEALTIGSSAVLKGASKISPIFTRSITESLAASGLRGVATSVASRAAIFSAFGAATGYALSGGDIEQAKIGAISGAVFSAGGDIFRYGVERGYIPIPKYGSVNVPFEIEGEEGVFYTEKPTWRGLYLSRGEKASMLFGKFSDFPESMSSIDDELAGVQARIASHGSSGEELGWKPVSSIESEVTLKTISRMGYGPQVIEDIGSFRQIMSATQYTKSKFIDDMLPSETGTLGEKGVSSLKDYVLRNKGQVEELYGSFGTRPQLSTEFEYTLTTPSGDVISALRTPADIDIQLGTSDLGKASKFASDLTRVLKGVGETVRISSESPTMIEADVGGKWAHAVDIHYAGEPNADLISAGGWGYKYARPTTQIEKLPVMSLSEQGLRKGADSILGFNYDMSIGPVAHRLKDVPDFFQVQRTLLESARPSGKVAEAQSLLSGLAERYNVNLSNLPPIGESYIVSGRPTVFPSAPIMVSPLISAMSGAPSSSIGKAVAYPSKLAASIKTSAASPASILTSTPKLIINMVSSMSVLSPKKSSGASSLYSSVSRLVSPSSYASKIKYSSPKSFSRSLSPSSAFSKSVSRVLSVSSIKLSPSTSLSKIFSYPSSPVSSKSVLPQPSYPSYPKSSSSYPSSYPSISSTSSPSSYPSISLTSLSPPTFRKPRLPTGESVRSKRRIGKGEWFKRSHPILEPKQVFSQFWGGSLSKANLKTWKVGVRKTKRSKTSAMSNPVTEERLQIFTPGREYSYDSGWVTKVARRSRKK